MNHLIYTGFADFLLKSFLLSKSFNRLFNLGMDRLSTWDSFSDLNCERIHLNANQLNCFDAKTVRWVSQNVKEAWTPTNHELDSINDWSHHLTPQHRIDCSVSFDIESFCYLEFMGLSMTEDLMYFEFSISCYPQSEWSFFDLFRASALFSMLFPQASLPFCYFFQIYNWLGFLYRTLYPSRDCLAYSIPGFHFCIMPHLLVDHL